MIKYLKPLQLYGETMKITCYMPSAVFLGLNFSDEYASVAMSDDCYLTAGLIGTFPRDETLLEKLVEPVRKFASLNLFNILHMDKDIGRREDEDEDSE
ncbi:hypothetical protein QYF36_024307 [Acer negundo]|nr:hypothetical protein QYF36_024307 [Acer negundo]